jgi:Domain of unknown function (DUF6894)
MGPREPMMHRRGCKVPDGFGRAGTIPGCRHGTVQCANANQNRDSRMRYYFRLTDGKEEINPHKGIDLLGDAAAREEAVRFARGIKASQAPPGGTWDAWFIRIVDQHGKEIDTVPFDAVPDGPEVPVP